MSENAINLQSQAAKCRVLASGITDVQTQDELRRLAAEYIVRAAALEGKKSPF
jgi:hypothetical protein